jgi:hypothetical protein
MRRHAGQLFLARQYLGPAPHQSPLRGDAPVQDIQPRPRQQSMKNDNWTIYNHMTTKHRWEDN